MSNSERLRRFLRYVVVQTVEGRSEGIKEYAIGVEVFGKGQDFDPRTDPIVRADAARLREKLRLFYNSEGAGAACEIDLPKGGYVPVFRERSIAPAPPAPTGNPAIVVLPFTSESDDYFADGLTEELTIALARTQGLRVVARTTAAQYKGLIGDVREIGRHLGVGSVLEGSVRKSREGVRISAQLIAVSDGCTIWSDTFDRHIEDAIAVQEDVARAVAGALHVQLLGVKLARRQSENQAAYELYLRGKQGIRQWTVESMRAGMDHVRQAIAIDPDYAAAWATLAETAAVMMYFGVVPGIWMANEALAAAAKALALDPNSSEAHVASGILQACIDHDWPAAKASFERALAVNPQDPSVMTMFAYAYHAPRADTAEMLRLTSRAIELDPADPMIHLGHANAYQWAGRFDDAIAAYDRGLLLFRNMPQMHWNAGYCYCAAGETERGIAEYRLAGELTGSEINPLLLGDFARVLALANKAAEAREILATLEDRARQSWVPPLALAWTHIGLGDLDAAFPYLERAVADRHMFCVWFRVDSRYKALDLGALVDRR